MDPVAPLRAWYASTAAGGRLRGFRNVVRAVTDLSCETTCQFKKHIVSVTPRVDVHRIKCTMHPTLPFMAVGVTFMSPSRFVDGGAALYIFSCGPYKACWKQMGVEIPLHHARGVYFHPKLPLMGVVCDMKTYIYGLPDGTVRASIGATSTLSWHPSLSLLVARNHDLTCVWDTEQWSKAQEWKTVPSSYLTKFMEHETADPLLCTLEYTGGAPYSSTIVLHDIERRSRTTYATGTRTIRSIAQLPCRSRVAFFTCDKYMYTYSLASRCVENILHMPEMINMVPFGRHHFVGHRIVYAANTPYLNTFEWMVKSVRMDDFTDTDEATKKGMGIKIHPGMRYTAVCSVDPEKGACVYIEKLESK